MKPASHSSGSSRFGSTRSLAAGLLALTGAGFAVGCLERPVEPITPTTSNVFVDYIPNSKIDKIDLLFVVDNSVSMADKQAILEQAVPRMVQRLVNPNCVNADTGESVDNTTGECPSGFAQEFSPINDIHIGVISSSLGGHGAMTYEYGCSDVPPQNDRSLLMPIVRSNDALPMSDPTGFLAWAPADNLSNADKVAAANQLAQEFAQHVVAAGEAGCGFEATLESWYRFLVDPSPPAGMVVAADSKKTASTGRDENVIAQRNAFLRDDSLVAIIVLSDENDCSAMEGGSFYKNAGYGWLVADVSAGPGTMFGGFPPASDVCATNPNDRCCYSCLEGVPADCADSCPPADPVTEQVPPMAPELDRANTRCFDSKRRFGIDLLYPTSRYVAGLSNQRIIDSQTGLDVDNPLLVHPVTGLPRPPGLVFYAAIVGVPWQDIATQGSLNGPGLKFLTAAQMSAVALDSAGNALPGEPTTWDVILGQPNLSATDPACTGGDAKCGVAPRAPLDPLMIESIGPRQGANPITGAVLVQPGDAGVNDINGHEYANAVSVEYYPDGSPANDDLQYACIFQLEEANEDCTKEARDCDCGYEPDKNRPLCQATPDGAAPGTTTQYWAKAYPGLRFLEVARDFGANSILGSICPKVLDQTHPDFGYNPAVNAIVDRLAETLKGQCLPRPLTLGEDGTAPCAMVEALSPTVAAEQGVTGCTDGRSDAKAQIVPAVRQQLQEARLCSGTDCDAWLLCELPQHAPGTDAGNRCFSSEGPENQTTGYCYIDPAKGPTAGGQGANCSDDPESWVTCTNPNTDSCGPTEKRLLRFVGSNTPRADSATVVACTADAASGSPVLPDLPAPSTGGGSN